MGKNPREIQFREMARLALMRSQAKPATKRGYRRWLDLVEPTLGALQCGEVQAGDVRAALVDARDSAGLAPKSVANVLGAVRIVLSEAGCREVAASIRIPQQPRQLRALGRGEACALRERLEGYDGTDERAVQALLGTGVRLGELLDLTPDDLEPSAERLHVRGTKSGNAARVVDLPDGLGRRLCPAEPHATRLFETTPGRLRRTLHRHCQALGLPRIRIHDLRHTRLTGLLLGGAPVLYVAEQAGHASPAYTMRVYGHVMAASQAERRRWCNV